MRYRAFLAPVAAAFALFSATALPSRENSHVHSAFVSRATRLAAMGLHAPVRATRLRIVSLMPSLTEDLFAIGAGAQLVGTSQATDYPAAAAHLPQVASSASLDAERVVRLHPQLVVGIPAQAALVAPLQRAGVRVALMRDDSFGDIFTDLKELGVLSGHAPEAAALIRQLRARTAKLAAKVPRGARPSTFVVLGADPIYTVGRKSYIAQLLALAGARDAARLDAPYARYSAEALLASQPDVIVADAASGFGAVRDRLPWSALRAVRDGHAYILADSDILERPGPRYNAGLAWLIARLHPTRLGARSKTRGVVAPGRKVFAAP